MTQPNTLDLRIADIRDVSCAALICEEHPVSAGAAELIRSTREAVHHMLEGKDDFCVNYLSAYRENRI